MRAAWERWSARAGLVSTALRERDLVRTYDAFAPRYEIAFGDLQRRRADHMLAVLARLHPGRSFRVAVDLGCGTGILARRLTPVADRIIGIDRSEGMLREARRRACDPCCAFRNADILAAPDPAESADLIACLGVLSHIPPARHYEFARAVAGWLRPGGVAMVGVTAGPWRPFLPRALSRGGMAERLLSGAYNTFQRGIGISEHRDADMVPALRRSFADLGFAAREVPAEDHLTILMLERPDRPAGLPLSPVASQPFRALAYPNR